MQRITLVPITLTLLIGLALWRQHHVVVVKAADISATFIVTSTADAGTGTLRKAIADANLAAGADTITFDAVAFATQQTITLTSGELAITDSLTITGPGASILTISGNLSSRIFSIGSGNLNVTLSGLTVINGRHTAPGGGAGILNLSSGTLTLANSAMSGNSVSGLGALRGSGGAILNAGNGAVVLSNSVLSDNAAYGLASVDIGFGQGGGIFNAGNGPISLTNSVLSSNSANGAVFGFGQGFGEGGGIYNAGNGTVTLTSTTLSGNAARSSVLPGAGGGIFNASTGTVTIISSTLSDNDAIGSQGLGGGIVNTDGILTLTNSTLSGNSGTGGAIGKGGGIYNGGTGTLTLTNSTLSGNSVVGLIQSEGGGIFNSSAGTVNARNTLIASNFASILAPDVHGAFNSQGHNLIGDGTGSSGFAGTGDKVGTSGLPMNAMLAPLGANGGLTQTHALLPGSPAINSGDNCVIQNPGCLGTPLSTDQRGTGFLRSVDGIVDIGAYEVGPIEYEADVSPRPFGSGTLSLIDWVQAGRFAVGLDAVSGTEFQRADCAPRDTRGNGVLSLADWVQAGRYAIFLDPIVPVGGPINAGLTSPEHLASRESKAGYPGMRGTQSVWLVNSTAGRSNRTMTALWLDSAGIENAVSFSVSFDPSAVELVSAKAGPGATGAVLISNLSNSSEGLAGFALALAPGHAVQSGWRCLVELEFRPLRGELRTTTTASIAGDQPAPREVVDVWGNHVPATWSEHLKR